MPVTFSPAPHNNIEGYRLQLAAPSTSASILKSSYRDPENKRPIVEHLQGSFGQKDTDSVPITARRNGFVDTVVDAYNQHQALVIRPDDVWLCILTQFSLFVNGEGQAERLRYLFVAHEGQKELEIRVEPATRYTFDFGWFAEEMTKKIHENVVDPELREWILPDFSTTTPNDTVVGSVVMMATLKAYFKYLVAMTLCGLPRVTLLGTQDDWLSIFHRVEKLGRYGPETTAWMHLLRPILARFVKAFEPGYAESAENIDFWQRVAHRYSGGSGPSYLSGWITAFCAFNDRGEWLGSESALSETSEVSPYDQDGFKYNFGTIEHADGGPYGASTLKVDGIAYHRVDTSKVPTATVDVDVKLDDNGEKFDCVMVAGLVGTSVADATTNDETVVQKGEISPASAWWIFTV